MLKNLFSKEMVGTVILYTLGAMVVVSAYSTFGGLKVKALSKDAA